MGQRITQHQKNEATARILALVRLLSANNELTRQDIFERLPEYYRVFEGASARKFERDLEFLQDQGYSIEHIKGKLQPTRYRMERGSGAQALLIAEGAEIDALILLFNLFANPNAYAPPTNEVLPFPVLPSHPFAEMILAVVERFINLLPEDQQQQVQKGIRKPYIYFNLQTMEDYLPHRETIDRLIEAISWRRQVQFEYLPMQRDLVVHCPIDPYYIFFGDGHFYLLGYSHKTSQHLEFRVDRIKTLSLLPTRIDIERRRRPTEFRYWISGNIAKRGLSYRWLWQTIEREETYQDNGCEKRRVLVRAAAYNEWRIIKQMLHYGDQAELIEPAHLREEMKKTIARMASMYGMECQDEKDKE